MMSRPPSSGCECSCHAKQNPSSLRWLRTTSWMASRERAPVGTPPSVGGAPSPELVASPALAPGPEPEPVVSLPRITATSPVPGGALGSAPEPAGAAADGAPPSTSELAPTTGGADEDGSVTEAWLDARGTSASG